MWNKKQIFINREVTLTKQNEMRDLKNVELVREIEINFIKNPNFEVEPIKMTSPDKIEKVLRAIFPKDILIRESFVILYLDYSNKVIGYHTLSKGGITSTLVDVRILYSIALKCLATSVVLCHNHPSGGKEPSEADIQVTKKIQKAGDVLDIKVLDHIILYETGYYSFMEDDIL